MLWYHEPQISANYSRCLNCFSPTCPRGSFAILDQWDAQKPVDFMRSPTPGFCGGLCPSTIVSIAWISPYPFFTSVGCKTFGISPFLWMALNLTWLRFTDFHPPTKTSGSRWQMCFFFWNNTQQRYQTNISFSHIPPQDPILKTNQQPHFNSCSCQI